MAFSGVAARGNAVDTVSDNSVAMNPTANLTVGKIVIVQCTTTQFATVDGTTTDHALADSKNNVWTKIAERSRTAAGVAHDGTAISLWRTVVTTEILTTDTITLTLTGNSAEKIICAIEATFDNVANNIALEQLGEAQTIAASVTGMASREYFLVGAGTARGSDNTKTPDADYTEWHDLRNRNNAAAITNHLVSRIATLTADTCTSSAWTVSANTECFLLAALYESAKVINSGVGTAAGVGTASGVGSIVRAGVGTATGIGTAAGVSPSANIQSGVGTAAGVGAATGSGAVLQPYLPNAVLATTNLKDTSLNSPPTDLTDIQDDPDSPDADWWTAVNPVLNTSARLGLQTPGGSLVVAQAFELYLRKTAGAGNPTVSVDLYENGVLVQNLVSGVSITSTSGQKVTVPWNASLVTNRADAEIRIVGTAS